MAKTLIKRRVDVEVFTEHLRSFPARLLDDPISVRRLWVPGYRNIRTFLLIRAFSRVLLELEWLLSSCRKSFVPERGILMRRAWTLGGESNPLKLFLVGGILRRSSQRMTRVSGAALYIDLG